MTNKKRNKKGDKRRQKGAKTDTVTNEKRRQKETRGKGGHSSQM